MDFNETIATLASSPRFNLSKIVSEIRNQLEDIKQAKKMEIIREHEYLDSSIDKFTEEHLKDYYKNLLDLYTETINSIYNEIDNIESSSLYENEKKRKLYEIFLDLINSEIEGIIFNKDPDTGHYIYNESINLEKYKSRFRYYPLIDEGPEFVNKLIEKKEFFYNQNSAPTKSSATKTGGFTKSSVQKFVKNYISESTPYNGLLLWHEVGVGKTCAAIGIAENFKNKINTKNKKITILTPSQTLTESWKDEIYNIKKELKNPKSNFNKQCTGDIYSRYKIIDKKKRNYDRLKKKRDKIIKKFYDITGYGTFVNTFKKNFDKYHTDIDDEDKKKFYDRHLIQFISEKYSDTVFILDEIHGTREDVNSSKKKDEGKEIRRCLELIVRYSNNLKLVLLSATPMYDKAPEILWLINLLRLNDKRSPIYYQDYFTNNKLEDNPDIKEKFKNKIRGYISYQRGEDPFVFPTKLYPSVESSDWENLYIPNNKECIKLSGINDIEEFKSLFRDKFNKVIGTDTNNISVNYQEKINNLVIYRSFMHSWQYGQYKKFSDYTDDSQKSFKMIQRQKSNIIFPGISPTNTLIKAPRQDNFDTLFKNNKGKYIIHEALKVSNKSIFDKTRIGKYSKKFENILNIINKSKGIIFIFTRLINYGAKSLAFLLEENGFNRFYCNAKGVIDTNKNFIDNPSVKKDPSKNYIYLTGETSKPVLNKLKDYCNSYENRFGDRIKVIIGSSVVEEGLSFFNVRQVHILDPWYNVNSLNQIIGRAVRRYSHYMLSNELRNVTIFLHAAVAPKDSILSTVDSDTEELIKRISVDKSVLLIDENLYSLSLEKYKEILKVQRLLKEGAVDCNLNKKGNIFIGDNPSFNVNAVDSRNNDRGIISLRDLEGSIKCNLENCDYTCYPEVDLESITVNTDTYNPNLVRDDIMYYKDIIKNIFLDILAIDLEQLIKKIKVSNNFGIKTDSEIKDIIRKALKKIIDDEEVIYNKIIKKTGVLTRKENVDRSGRETEYYIFTSFNESENELIRNKYLPAKKATINFDISDIEVKEVKEIKSKKYSNTINNLIDLLLLSIFNSIITYWEDAYVEIKSQGLEMENIANDLKSIKSFTGNQNRINYKDSGEVTKFGYDKKGILKFGNKDSLDLQEILERRTDLQFNKKYAFNNFRLSVFSEGKYNMVNIEKPKKNDEIKVKLDPSSEDETIILQDDIGPDNNFIINRFYNKDFFLMDDSGVRLPKSNLPDIYDIIYNHFLSYIEDKPLEMKNDILKNIFKEICNEPIENYIDPFFMRNIEGDIELEPRIDFSRLNNREILRQQVIRILLYSYFSGEFTISSGETIKTHNFKKFSYFLTNEMYNKSVGISSSDESNLIKYLVLPTSSVPVKSQSKKKKKLWTKRDGEDSYNMYIKQEEEVVRFTPINVSVSEEYFNSLFSQDLENPFKAKIFSFTKVSKDSSFHIVVRDPKVDDSYKETYVISGAKSKKTKRTGAPCGQALGGKTKPNLGKLINAVIYRITGDKRYKKYNEVGDYRWKANPNKPDLCMELKFLLRYLDHLDYYYDNESNRIDKASDRGSDTRFFYHEHIKKKIDRNIEI